MKNDFEKDKFKILYEDNHLAVIYKPEGLLSVPYPGSTAKTALTLLEQIMRKKGTFSKNHRPFAVHRLDRETSGIMMFALSENAKKIIMDSWQKIVTKRIYRAVAENSKNPLPDSGTISDGLAYNAYNIAFVPDKNSKEKFKTLSAITHYKIIQRGKSYTLFELNLETGRKNQIRCHLASKGYIIAGDKNYNSNKNPFSRLALHAKTLSFIHPFTNEELSFESPEPDQWLSFVKNQDETKNQPHKKTSFSKLQKTQNSSSLNSTCGKKLKKMDFIQRGKTLHKH